MIENNIDFGEWKVPESWDEITLKQFEDIERYYSDEEKEFDVREVLHILCNKTVDEVNSLPMQFTEKILEKLSFVQEKMPAVEPTNKIVIDNVKYQINYMEKLKTGEYVSVDAILKSDKFNYAAMLAVLCRKPNEIYDSKFEAEMLDARIKMFEQQPITKVKAVVDFFLHLYILSQAPSKLSLEVQAELSRIRESIKSSRESGALSALSTKLLMRRLTKLEKSIKSI